MFIDCLANFFDLCKIIHWHILLLQWAKLWYIYEAELTNWGLWCGVMFHWLCMLYSAEATTQMTYRRAILKCPDRTDLWVDCTLESLLVTTVPQREYKYVYWINYCMCHDWLTWHILTNKNTIGKTCRTDNIRSGICLKKMSVGWGVMTSNIKKAQSHLLEHRTLEIHNRTKEKHKQQQSNITPPTCKLSLP